MVKFFPTFSKTATSTHYYHASTTGKTCKFSHICTLMFFNKKSFASHFSITMLHFSTSLCSIYGRSHNHADVIFKFSIKIWSKWYVTLLYLIYGKSHDHTDVIFKFSMEMQSEWCLTSLFSMYGKPHVHADVIFQDLSI